MVKKLEYINLAKRLQIFNMNTYNDTYNYKYGNNFIIIIGLLFYLCFNLTKSIISYYKKKKKKKI